MSQFFIESLAQPDELVLTQFTVRPDENNMRTKEQAEKTLSRRYGNYKLRFKYEWLEYAERKVSSR